MTRRDLKFQEDDNRKVGDVMTKENLVTSPEDTSLEEAELKLPLGNLTLPPPPEQQPPPR